MSTMRIEQIMSREGVMIWRQEFLPHENLFVITTKELLRVEVENEISELMHQLSPNIDIAFKVGKIHDHE